MKPFKRVFRNCAFRFFSSLTKSKMFPWCPVLNVSLLILFIWMQRRRGYAAFKLYYISFRLQASYHSVEILLTRLTRINVLLRHLKQQNNWLLLLEYMIWRRWTLLIVLRCSSFFFRFWFETSKWNHFFPSQVGVWQPNMRNSILLIQQTLFNLSLLKAKRNTTDHSATKNVCLVNEFHDYWCRN